MKQTEEGYKFESTGREFSVHGRDGLSLTEHQDGLITVQYGCDGYVEFDQAGESSTAFTDEERKELAAYMISLWSKFGIPSSFTSIEYCPNPQAIKIHTTKYIKDNSALEFILESVEGVEKIMINSKYDILIVIGTLFDRKTLAHLLQQKVEEYIKS